MTTLKLSSLSSFSLNSLVSMRSVSFIRQTTSMRSSQQVMCRAVTGPLGYTGIISREPDRQHHPKARLAWFRGDLKLSPVLVDDDVVGYVQTKTRAYAGSLRGIEGSK